MTQYHLGSHATVEMTHYYFSLLFFYNPESFLIINKYSENEAIYLKENFTKPHTEDCLTHTHT